MSGNKEIFFKELVNTKRLGIAIRCFFGKRDAWYRYIIPRRLTMKHNPPIYKWLCFVIYFE